MGFENLLFLGDMEAVVIDGLDPDMGDTGLGHDLGDASRSPDLFRPGRKDPMKPHEFVLFQAAEKRD